jgi:hypothetical protein
MRAARQRETKARLTSSSVSAANLVKGWVPDGFADGAGERRTFPR